MPRLRHEGRWLTDSLGRVVMLHGGNVIQLVGDAHLAGAGAGRDRWRPETPRLLAQAGFNGARLIVFMDRVAPQPNRIDHGYLDAVAATVTAYADQGVVTLIDFHQDEFGPEVGVRGLPAWMTLSDGHRRDRALRFPNGYFRDRAVQIAFDSFWANRETSAGVGVQDAYVAAAAAVAERFANDPGVFGFDLMNEPATGTPCSQPDPKLADCPHLEHELLAPFYSKAGRAFAAVAPRSILFVEPFMLQGALGIPIHTPAPEIELRGLSYHNYGPFRPTREAVSRAALAHATEVGAAILNTEWGFSHDAADLASQAQDFDTLLIPWLAWARGPFEALVNPAADTVAVNREAVLRAYARPYPAATAGTPLALAFDADAGVLDYRWSTQGPHGVDRSRLETEIRMPPPSFPRGYHVDVRGARVLSAPNAPLLVVHADPGAVEATVHAERIGDLPPLAAPATQWAPEAKLSLDSLLGDLLRDPRARAILEKHLPTLTSSSQIGLASQTSLRAMQPYLPEMSDEVARAIEAELAALSSQ